MSSTDYDEISSLLDVVFDEGEKLAAYMGSLDDPTATDAANEFRDGLFGWHDHSLGLMAQMRMTPDGPIKDHYRNQALTHFNEMREFMRQMRIVALLMLEQFGTKPPRPPEA